MGRRLDPLFYIADELCIELPEQYCEFFERLVELDEVQAVLGDRVLTDPVRVVELNQATWVATPIAGLQEWPDDYFVIGEDGCGNYYLVDDGETTEPVLFYDHATDAIYRRADSLEAFANRLIQGEPLEAIHLHSGYQSRREKARENPQTPPQIHFGDDSPAWSENWFAFVETLVRIYSVEQPENELTVALNNEFGGRCVSWVGKLTDLDLGEHKSASIALPAIDHIAGAERFPSIGSLSVGLRTDEDGFDHVEQPYQLRTTVASWKAASIGDTIRFLMRIAPGHEDRIPCIRMTTVRSGRSWATINDCGAHLIEVIREE